MRRTRWLLCGLVVLAGAQQASAADLSDMFLRGSNTVITAPGGTNWEGFYFGGHVGAAYAGADFSEATMSLIETSLRSSIYLNAGVHQWNVLGKYDASGSSVGGFAGYNFQWDDAVVGVELSYNRTNLALAAAGSMGRQPAGIPDAVYVDATASMRLTDYGTARVRGGWATGSFMPYAFVGLALGRADVTRSVTTNLVNGAGINFFTDTITDNKLGDLAYGYTAGLGVDFCVMQNLFVRAEYEYVGFGAFNGIKAHIQTARIGAGIKF
jgi:outer membrane immunogenic protein